MTGLSRTQRDVALPRDVAWIVVGVFSLLLLLSSAAVAAAQTAERDIIRIDLPVGRSFPIQSEVPVTQVSVANPEIADVAVIGERDVVINARSPGETDVIVYSGETARRHYRVLVRSPADRMQIALYVKFAEVRRDRLRELAASALYRDEDVRVGTGVFRSDDVIQPDGSFIFPPTKFLTILTDFATDDLLAFLELEETRGNARVLAEPNILAANKDTAQFLAGGELPIPIARPGAEGTTTITIQYREFGVRLRFVGEIISDSLLKLNVRPEVSDLDFVNALLISGFRIPALRTRRVESTIDVKRNQSLIISGLFNTTEERVKTGVPLLMDIPILGQLFSSTRFQRNETELLIVVTPVILDPMRPRLGPRVGDVLQVRPDTTLPARESIEPRLVQPPKSASPPPR